MGDREAAARELKVRHCKLEMYGPFRFSVLRDVKSLPALRLFFTVATFSRMRKTRTLRLSPEIRAAAGVIDRKAMRRAVNLLVSGGHLRAFTAPRFGAYVELTGQGLDISRWELPPRAKIVEPTEKSIYYGPLLVTEYADTMHVIYPPRLWSMTCKQLERFGRRYGFIAENLKPATSETGVRFALRLGYALPPQLGYHLPPPTKSSGGADIVLDDNPVLEHTEHQLPDPRLHGRFRLSALETIGSLPAIRALFAILNSAYDAHTMEVKISSDIRSLSGTPDRHNFRKLLHRLERLGYLKLRTLARGATYAKVTSKDTHLRIGSLITSPDHEILEAIVADAMVSIEMPQSEEKI